MMFSMKGQGATEYLVLLAVVLMIALVSIALLGFFPGLAGDAKKTQSDSYWKSSRPFGILEHSQSGATLSLLVQNNDPDLRTITNISAGIGFNSTSSIAINGGEKRTINILNASTSACTSGLVYEYNLNITYNSADITGQKQTGTKPIIGKCV